MPAPPMGIQPSAYSAIAEKVSWPAGRPDQYPHPRLLHRLRPRPARRELDVLAVELGLVLRPDLLHAKHLLAGDRSAVVEIDPMVGRLDLVPPEADPEHEASARDVIESCHLLGEDDGVVLRDEAHAGSESQPRSSPPPPPRERRMDRALRGSRRAPPLRPPTAGTSASTGMWVCSGR